VALGQRLELPRRGALDLLSARQPPVRGGFDSRAEAGYAPRDDVCRVAAIERARRGNQ
jgi:hypothetical protein